MTIGGMELAFFQAIYGFVFFLPLQIIKLIGMFTPACSSFGITALPASWMNNAAQMGRWMSPLLVFIPVNDLWLLLNVYLTWWLIKWIIRHLPWLMSFGARTWVIIAILYVVLAGVNFFTSADWSDSSVFSSAFGGSPSSTWAGGGLGGGGGGSW